MNSIPVLDLILSFLGGILGAAIGGLNAFILCGLSLLVGTILDLLGVHSFPISVISWGPFLGPHVAFSGGVAAAAYAAEIGKITTGRDIVTRLARFASPMIYIVGGIFGIAGYLLKTFTDMVPTVNGIPWFNSIAFSITINAVIVRIFFGKSGLFNNFKEPYVSWQPWRMKPKGFFIMAVGISAISAFIVRQTPSLLGIMFGITSLSLIFLYLKIKIPILLHIAWASEFTAFLSGDIGWGIAFGILTAVVGELCAYLFLVQGDTHIDPPAMSLAIVFSVYPAMVAMGVIKKFNPYSFEVALLFLLSGFLILFFLDKRSGKAVRVEN